MRSSIRIKFQSEAEFDRLPFHSQVVSYDEIKKYLERKKKLVFADKKTDKIVLMDVNRNKEFNEGFIEPDTRLIVMRTPLVTGDPIELTYNPKQTGGTFDKHGGKVRLETKDGQLGDTNEVNIEENKNDEKSIEQDTNLSSLGKEFTCPLPNPHEKKTHLIIDPVILSCCGTTCCLECIVKIFMNIERCPFCYTKLKQSGVKIFPNLPIQRLFNQELIKVYQQLNPEEKERLQKIQAYQRLQEEIVKMPRNIKNPDAQMNEPNPVGPGDDNTELDPIIMNEQKDPAQRKNPLFEMMQNAMFILMKAPNQEFLQKGVLMSEWCFQEKSVKRIKETQVQNILCFVSVKDSGSFQGVFMIQSKDVRPVSEDWIKIYPGQYDGQLDIQWLSFPDLSFTKTQKLTNQQRDNEPLNKFKDGEEVNHELGQQLCKLCVDSEKAQSASNASKMKAEYIKNHRYSKELKKQRELNLQYKSQHVVVLSQEEQEILEKIKPLSQTDKEKANREIKSEDLNIMVYEDIASPTFFSKDKDDRRTRDRRTERESEKKDDKKSKRDEEKDKKPSATITVPIAQAIPTIPTGGMFRPPYGYYQQYYPVAPNMMQPMYGYPNPMMGRPGMMHMPPSGMPMGMQPAIIAPQPEITRRTEDNKRRSRSRNDREREKERERESYRERERDRDRKKHSRRSRSPHSKKREKSRSPRSKHHRR
ncbi:yth domain-containing protein 1 [Stylonychia lemnae]|uniref:Yth domain-containing protein 1 n=1 Tax=Stylonychia lemnae TaxID=5949 RepID=A0A078B1S5_STYLE|nr:yth domain-containing protein 1 [Stylonychia lemnae]|eukprot:CDW87243.1 yth domain-containing protein 1 [Stylonychia lemnae]